MTVVMLYSNIIFCKSSGRSEYLVPSGTPGITYVSYISMSATRSYCYCHCVLIRLKTLKGFMPRTRQLDVMIVDEKKAA